jgi:signal peptidase I
MTTESQPGSEASNALAASPPAVPKSSSSWKRGILAGVLSLFFSGMGQLYNRQPRRALLFGAIAYLPTALMAHTRVLLAFPTMIATLLVGLVWKLFVVGDAVRANIKEIKPESEVPVPKVTYPLLVVVLLAVAIASPSIDSIKRDTGFSAFRVPSHSMCPTICVGERIVADLKAYASHPPQRGDLIMMANSSVEGLLIKRVIGLPGDIVSPGPNGSVVVNGRTFSPPSQSCAPAAFKRRDSSDDIRFYETTVPEGTYFIVGDNLGESFDSRSPEFGAATPSMVRGKPLYLYWSSKLSRVGCQLH